MPYGVYKKKLQIMVDAGATDTIVNPLGRVPDEVLVERESGDAALELASWTADDFEATNPGALQNISTLVLIYNHSLIK